MFSKWMWGFGWYLIISIYNSGAYDNMYKIKFRDVLPFSLKCIYNNICYTCANKNITTVFW